MRLGYLSTLNQQNLAKIPVLNSVRFSSQSSKARTTASNKLRFQDLGFQAAGVAVWKRVRYDVRLFYTVVVFQGTWDPQVHQDLQDLQVSMEPELMGPPGLLDLLDLQELWEIWGPLDQQVKI